MAPAELRQEFRDLAGLRLESRRVTDLEGQLKTDEVGKAADLVGLAENLSHVPVERLREVGVVVTLVAVRSSTKRNAER